MSHKKILFTGCSFTENCGFTDENQRQYHWPHLICNHYNAHYYNAAIGGCSNEEIFYKTIEHATATNFDLVVVMWSFIGRHWIYYSTPNIDDFTQINNGKLAGYNKNSSEVKAYSKLHYMYFNNQYINLKKWLLQIISLGQFFYSRQQPYVFIKSTENELKNFNKIQYNAIQGFTDMTNNIKELFDFDNLPDYYIEAKVKIIQNLIEQARNFNWLNFDQLSLTEFTIDRADDGQHPGPKSNKILCDNLISYCDQQQLISI